ncbi:MAG: protein-tyrosine phosphatase family protein [Archangium sp.]
MYWVETGSSARLGIMARPRGGEWLDNELRGLAQGGVQVLASMLTDEESDELGLGELTRKTRTNSGRFFGVDFLRFPIPDREVPRSEAAAVEFARRLHERLVAGENVAIHCRMGIGRSSLMAALVLRLCGLDADEAFKRLGAARGFPVPDTAEQRAWVTRARL